MRLSIVDCGQDTLRGKTGWEKCLEGWQVVGGNTLSISRGIQVQLKTGIASRKLGRASPHAYPQAWYMLFLLNKKQKMMQQGTNTSPWSMERKVAALRSEWYSSTEHPVMYTDPFFFFLLFLFFNCNIDYVQNYVSYRYIEQWFTIFKVFALLIVTIKYWLYCLCCIKYPFRLLII